MSQSRHVSTEDLAGRPQVPDGKATPNQADIPDGGPAAPARPADSEGYGTSADPDARPAEDDISLVDEAQAGQFRDRWSGVQARFVDDPRAAVGAADTLVAELMQTLAGGFADHKGRLETQWQGGGEADTEELRLALRRYRVFFQRLLQT